MNVTNEFMNRILENLRQEVPGYNWEKNRRWKWLKTELDQFDQSMSRHEEWHLYQAGMQCLDFDSKSSLRRFRKRLFDYLKAIEWNMNAVDPVFKSSQAEIREMRKALIEQVSFIQCDMEEVYQKARKENNTFLYPDIHQAFK